MFKSRIQRKRIFERNSAFWPVEIHGRNDKRRVTGTLKDLSAVGARISVDDEKAAPDLFKLLCSDAGIYVDCHVKWRRRGELGVEFDEDIGDVSHMVSKNSPEDSRMIALKRLSRKLAAI